MSQVAEGGDSVQWSTHGGACEPQSGGQGRGGGGSVTMKRQCSGSGGGKSLMGRGSARNVREVERQRCERHGSAVRFDDDDSSSL
eukprot:1523915-Rhodomonas_salina.2